MPGREPEDRRLAAGGIEQSAQHLEHGGLAGTVGAEESDEFTFIDAEAHAVDSAHFFILPPEETADGTREARSFPVRPIDLCELARLDGGHGVLLCGRLVFD